MPNKNNTKKVAPTKNIVFVMSSPYSGSTWTSFILGSHSQSAFLGEYRLIFDGIVSNFCNLCSAKGIKDCKLMGDISVIKKEDAYRHAFAKINKPILIDSSKNWDWLDLQSKLGYKIKIVYLLRNLYEWFCSYKRRVDIKVEDALKHHQKENKAILKKIEQYEAQGVQSMKVNYSNLAKKPRDKFAELFKFLGLSFEPKALDYWEKEHHCLAGNGAAYNNLLQVNNIKEGENWQKAPIITADQKFYKNQTRKNFVDERWKKELDKSEISYIRNFIEKEKTL